MEEPQFHPSFQAEKAQVYQQNEKLEGNPQKRGVTKPRDLHASQQRFRHETETKAAQRSTIALSCGWIVEHQLGTTF